MKQRKNKAVTIHMIANSHLDPVWFWRWQEGMNEIIPTCRTILDLMDEFSDLKFTKGEALMYRHLQEHDPATFARIKRMVLCRRWEIIGGWYNQPDTILSDGESLIRQGLYGQEYFEQEFGLRTNIAYLVDSFGQAGGLPQILKKSGFSYFVFHRPVQAEMALPSPLFQWESSDGSRIICIRLPGGYQAEVNAICEKIEKNIEMIPNGLTDWPVLFGLGDHGGGVSRKEIEDILELQKKFKKQGINVIFSSLGDFFKKTVPFQDNLPVFKGEMLYHGKGCLSAHSGIKQMCSNVAAALFRTEVLDSTASTFCRKIKNKNGLKQAWEGLLFNQFHDTICGTCSPGCYEDAQNQLGAGIHTADTISNAALVSIAKKMDTHSPGQAVIVINPHPWEVIDDVEVDWQLDYRPVSSKPEGYSVIDSKNYEVPSQEVPMSIAISVDWRKKILFRAGLAPASVNVFHILTKSGKCGNRSAIRAGKKRMTNRELSISVANNKRNLILTKQKEAKKAVLQFAGMQVIEDMSDTWAHGIDRFTGHKGYFQIQKTEWIETGHLRAVMRVTSKYRNSFLVQDVILTDNSDIVTCNACLDWREKHAVAKLIFALKFPVGHVKALRVGSWEEPCLDQGELPNGKLLIIHDQEEMSFGISCPAKGAYDVWDGKLRLTVARSSPYAWYRCPAPKEPGYYQYLDQGIQRFSYLLFAPTKREMTTKWVQVAAQKENPPISLLTFAHNGHLGKKLTLFNVSPSGLVLWAFKLREKGEGITLRFWNSLSRKVKYTIGFVDKQKIELMCAPEEIVTLLWMKDKKIKVADLLEKEIRTRKKWK